MKGGALALAIGGIVLLLHAFPVGAGVHAAEEPPASVDPPAPPYLVDQLLFRPEGSGPFPVVILLHGCSGVTQAELGWARELRSRGYAALIVDSFRPRGFREICTDFLRVTRSQRADDAYAALRWLRSQLFVAPDAIALMGFSNGGYALLEAIHLSSAREPRAFRAAVAMYPECKADLSASFYAPLLILMGGADDWTLARYCQEMAAAPEGGAGAPVHVHVYPGVHHSFDNPAVTHYYYAAARNPNKPGGCCGATVGYDASAHADAIGRVAEFLRVQLKPGR